MSLVSGKVLKLHPVFGGDHSDIVGMIRYNVRSFLTIGRVYFE